MKTKISQLLQSTLNHYLALDPETPSRLQALQGRVVTIELLSIGFVFQLIFAENKIQLKCDSSLPADTVIKGTPLRLWQMARTKQNRKAFFANDVSITGNLELGQQVIELFDHMEIDWEEYAAKFVGDTAAHHLGSWNERLKKVRQHFSDTLIQNVNEYVHEEACWFPTAEALQDFFRDVDTIRLDADRLEARLNNLQANLANRRGKL